MNKINVIGTTGSGKTTFSKKLSTVLGYPHIEMDSIYWGKNWHGATDSEFFDNLREALTAKQWVLDGNYSRTVAVKWADIDTLIWIDYGLLRTIYQSLYRALSRLISQKELWPGTGNKESIRKLFSNDSILLWLFRTYRKNKIKYAQLMDNPEYQHIEIIRLRSPKQCDAFLRRIAS